MTSAGKESPEICSSSTQLCKAFQCPLGYVLVLRPATLFAHLTHITLLSQHQTGAKLKKKQFLDVA